MIAAATRVENAGQKNELFSFFIFFQICAVIKKLLGEAILLCRSTIVGNVSHYSAQRRFRVALL